MSIELVQSEYRGGARELWFCRDPEILLEGPAGTGKTRALCHRLYDICERFKNARVLACRKTRASMTESVLVTFEEDVFPPDHEAVVNRVGRAFRRSYDFRTGSTIVLAGLDDPRRIMSTQFDIVACFEATELTQNDWEMLSSRLRHGAIVPKNLTNLPYGMKVKMAARWPKDESGQFIPIHQQIADCNPEGETHWLNLRAEQICDDPNDTRFGKPMMRRLLSRHEDNPRWHDGKDWTPEGKVYIDKLRRLQGVRRERLLLGKWVSATGLVWPEYSPDRHLIPSDEVPPLKWYFGSVDWGYRAPQVFQVWGVDGDTRIYRVAEWYYSEMNQDQWSDIFAQAYREFSPLKRIVADPEEPDRIDFHNKRMSSSTVGRGLPGLFVKANNAVQTGLDVVRDGFQEDRLFLVRDALRRCDEKLIEAHLPVCTEQEIVSYSFELAEDGKPVKERPDPACADHGCDALRYAAMFAWGKDWSPRATTRALPPGSIGAILGHDRLMERCIRRERRFRGREALQDG